jgi:septal ring factor EnvC (AmiA/AmiB activator)
VHEGRVAFADVFSGFGRLVIVDHGQGAFSLYGHLATIDVERGAHLDAGAVVGTSGRAPGGTPALYFELRVDGRPVDPLQWLKRR